MITKAALKASAKARKARKEGASEFTKIMGEGELARKNGEPQDSNPYAGTDDADTWDFGWEG